ncbi:MULTISPECIES: DUF3460 family protein [unclassified Janthinobacterium]|uniref:DUF3460 family protein n=1 Tax=unclassified Janthinobacterium TaxID=2610881 RepID=UPI001E4865BA|nr:MULTISPECIES: DUF3460 family protein [unclassified Janthinobacterium]MCC7645516.1 DUF3460 family protein [Janthinobacterium sp. EB271-G4-3-1]MCC7689548.1 DUF3460 family protein [Janthinobacterium sp. EB271-G4-3-2]
MRHRLPYRRSGYVSDFTRFIDGYLQMHPEVLENQRRGWRIWWERPAKLRELELIHADSVPEPPYHYD